MNGRELTDSEAEMVKGFLEDVAVEMRRATAKFGPIHTMHELLGILEEEWVEAKNAIFHNEGPGALRVELMHVAAMCVRGVVDLDLYGAPAPEPEPPKVPKPVVIPTGGLCECGHEARQHTDVGCLFSTNDKPIGEGRVYCRCLKYVEAATVTEVKTTVEGGEIEPVRDCTWTRVGNKCLWPSHSENGVSCERVSTGKPCGMFGQ